MRGLHVARVLLFLSLDHQGTRYPCALVHWFAKLGDEPDENTGMWVVSPRYYDPEPDEGEGRERQPKLQIIHIDAILRAAHLMPVFGTERIDPQINHENSLDYFDRFYVNKFVDHHANEIAF